MALPSVISYCKITGLFLEATADTTDDEDDLPQGNPLVGASVVFRAAPNAVKTASPAATTIPRQISCLTDASGYVYNPAGTTVGEDGNAVKRGVYILASDDPDIEPHNWSWSFSVTRSDIPSLSGSFIATSGGEVDLATYVPVPSSPGAETASWIVAVADTQAARDAAIAAKLAAEQAVTDAEAALTSKQDVATLEADVASKVGTGGALDAALSSTYGPLSRRFVVFGDSWCTPIDGVTIPAVAIAGIGGTLVKSHAVAGAFIGPTSQGDGNCTDAQVAAAQADTTYVKSQITDVLVIAGVNNIGGYLPTVAEARGFFSAIGALYPHARKWYVANSKRSMVYDSDPWRWYHRLFEGAALAGFAVSEYSPMWNLGTLRGQAASPQPTDYWDWANSSGLGSRHMIAAGQTAWANRLSGFLAGQEWVPRFKIATALHSNAQALLTAAGVGTTATIATDDSFVDGNLVRLNVSVSGMEGLSAVSTSSLQPILQLPEGIWPPGNYLRRVGFLSRLSGGTMTPYVIEITSAGVVQVDARGLNDHVGYFLINAEFALNTAKAA